ncbi:hypothetical protein ABKN59_011566 [Abortiporus biennis]
MDPQSLPFSEAELKQATLGPPVIWDILAILLKHGVDDVVVEWREAVPQQLSGSPLMGHVGRNNATYYVRRFLTPLLGVPLATQEIEEVDAQGTLTLYFHENKDKYGNPSDKVYGVTNCHVLCKETNVNYKFRSGAPRKYVRLCGMHRFQRGLDEITQAIKDHGILAEVYTRELAKLQVKGVRNQDDTEELCLLQYNLDRELTSIATLEAFHQEVTQNWSNINLDRTIGYVQHADPIKVDKNTGYTSDWAAFLVDETKVSDQFEGNVVDLGYKFSPSELKAQFYPFDTGPTTFRFPDEGKLRIHGCATKAELENPAEVDNEGQRYLMVGKDGNATDLTVGRYAGLISFFENEAGVESIEVGIYNSGCKSVEVFSDRGDSGALVWHCKNGNAYIVGQIHSGQNKGGSTSNHVTYCTPGWYLLEQIRKQFQSANFFPTSWMG